jgi:Domain of unknown function (DUF4262)
MSDPEPRPYITERTKLWRTRDVKPKVFEAIDIIETHGHQLMHVTADDVCPAFSYSAGAYDTSGVPEVITVGLPSNPAHHALNEAIRLMKECVDLTRGRHANIIGNVDVEFRKVDPKWLHQVMLRTDWFYDGEDVPVLQLIFPDLENRFQDEDDNFNEFFRQPILSGDIVDGTLAYNFWASHDDASSLSRWKFPDSPHTSSYLSQSVQDEAEPVTYVSHDADGDWQFLGDKMSEGGGPVLSCLHHPIDNDRTLEELHDLPPGWYATRERLGSPWERFEHPLEEAGDTDPAEPTLLN